MEISVKEISALVELASRAPKSEAEKLWLADFVNKVKGAGEKKAAENDNSTS